MSFGESEISVRFIQKPSRWTYMSDLITLIRQSSRGHQRTPRRGHHAKAERQRLPGSQPHLQAARPLGPPVGLHVAMSVLYRLLGCIYAVPYVGLIQGLTLDALGYIYQPLPPLGRIKSHLR